MSKPADNVTPDPEAAPTVHTPIPFVRAVPWRSRGSEEGVADAKRPVAGGSELGEFGVDGAEEVDVLAVCRGDVDEHVVVDAAPGSAHRFDRQPVVFGGPGDHGVRDQGLTPGLLGLLFEVSSNRPKLTSVTPCVSVACSLMGMSVALPRISSST